MNIEETIKIAMARMIERRKDISGVTVTSWEEEFERRYFSGCSTCGYDDGGKYTVYITYNQGEFSTSYTYYTYQGSFSELIRELDA